MATADAREVDLGQCLRATLDVDENCAQQTPMSNLARLLQLGNEPRWLREALLNRGDDESTRASRVLGPDRRVGDAPLQPGHRRNLGGMRVIGREVTPGLVDLQR